MKCRRIYKRVDVFPVPLEENHGTVEFLDTLLKLSNKIPSALAFFFDAELDLLAVGCRRMGEAIDALVDVRQCQQVEQDIKRRGSASSEPCQGSLCSTNPSNGWLRLTS